MQFVVPKFLVEQHCCLRALIVKKSCIMCCMSSCCLGVLHLLLRPSLYTAANLPRQALCGADIPCRTAEALWLPGAWPAISGSLGKTLSSAQ